MFLYDVDHINGGNMLGLLSVGNMLTENILKVKIQETVDPLLIVT